MSDRVAGYAMEEDGASVLIALRSKCRFWDIVTLLIWLALWTLGLVIAPSVILTANPGFSTVLAAVAVALAFGCGEAAGLYKLGYWLWGREVIRVTGKDIQIRRGIFGLGRTQVCSAADVSTMRVSPRRKFADDRHSPMMFTFEPGGSITIYRRGRAVRFGRNLTTEQAERLITDIRAAVACESSGVDPQAAVGKESS